MQTVRHGKFPRVIIRVDLRGKATANITAHYLYTHAIMWGRRALCSNSMGRACAKKTEIFADIE